MRSSKKKLFITLGVSLWIGSVLLVLVPIWPHIFYRLSPQTSTALAQTIGDTLLITPTPTPTPSIVAPTPTPTLPPPLPDLDPSLPTQNGMIIDSIGVRGEIHEGDYSEAILRSGLWRVPEFGTPENNTTPIIIAAHRWGYLSWTAAFRKLNSFYNLPNLKIGDTVQINWNQRKFIYKIYAEDTGESITDYSANLILYTCQLWNSPIRIFKYAKRVF